MVLVGRLDGPSVDQDFHFHLWDALALRIFEDAGKQEVIPGRLGSGQRR